MFKDAPIYHQLVAERGDVPARVRDAASTIRRELDQVMRTGQPSSALQAEAPAAGQGQRSASALPPGPHPR
ncbi:MULTISPECIES: hypothetical protein [Streptomyces]|uniref:Uncharacterized protein n=1 Tax=Streptomyces thermoviolaceus subsp. thermoviolaceus TaxID=66860 RepID=A0ABX0YVB0_STRTL|nr:MULTISPECIES: hypothetical protein [Streptomyces]MCM3265607.1 hypothetical protein [Streptomyces thermoviolaceus]NJP16540.1 hypothetical protein [Streptomyces thermoviolaceus subsp. thermoviolaceus]RSS05548.1 hypothetical protein EF917_08925 [Streptomyces sp. WAC00469]WTD46520.1 hypothetical protein OG899_02705 [Streptomyces thermoviolaceus]GGV82236.1 hypothetical protein GCM10010499_47680 [Streptomyces thermoviolaceus subsp. apingens]